MTKSNDGSTTSQMPVNLFDLGSMLVLLVLGFAFLLGAEDWSGAYVGSSQYGDGEFWWNGAVHFSKGLFLDNPGQGFRPGYFVFAGSVLAVLGDSYSVFHVFLISVFLASQVALYLAGRRLLGRAAALAGVAITTLSPFTAQWLGTSTTDGLGLTLNVLALACLLRAAETSYRLRWLAGFGFVFAAANLTRPLMAPFLVAVGLVILLQYRKNLLKGLGRLAVVATFFLIPMLTWMGIQKVLVGEWSVSTNDASAFYAASDPEIKCWSNEMYVPVNDSLKKENPGKPVTLKDTNQEFWRLTMVNYGKHWAYHLGRIMPHFHTLSQFGPTKSDHYVNRKFGDGLSLILPRKIILSLLLLGLGIQLFRFRPIWAVTTTSALAYLVLGPDWGVPILVPLGVLGGLVMGIARPNHAILLLVLYWLAGGVAMALVGGTGLPGSTEWGLNALGYRLGTQFFFVSSFIAVWAIQEVFALAGKTRKPKQSILPAKLEAAWQKLGETATSINRIAAVASIVFVTFCVVVLGGGMTKATWSHFSRRAATAIPFPDLQPALDWYDKVNPAHAPVQISKNRSTTYDLLTRTRPGKPEILFTGAVSSFIWDMPPQNRTQVLFYQQAHQLPFTMHPDRHIVQFPFVLSPAIWKNLQGAYFVRAYDDHAIRSNLAEFITEPSVRAFIPLSDDGKKWDLDAAQLFPAVLYATQLEASGRLRAIDCEFEWPSLIHEFRPSRAMILRPLDSEKDSLIALSVALDGIEGNGTFRFGWEWQSLNRGRKSEETPEIRAFIEVESDPARKELIRRRAGKPGVTLEELSLHAPMSGRLRIEFHGTPPGGIVLTELNFEGVEFR